MTAIHVSEEKKRTVAQLASLLKKYPIIGALNMEGLPAKQLQDMREQLRGRCLIRMSKRRLMKVALEEVADEKDGIEQLHDHLKGMPALLFTEENPFTLFKTLKQNKSPAPAKAGQEAPKDITITAGPTPFAPGPIIGELGKFGLQTGVEGGKVAIEQDKVVAEQGEEISQDLANLLTRLDIKPMEVGLDLTAVYEDGDILPRSVLDIDQEQYMQDLQAAAQGAMNLAVNAEIHTAQTTPRILDTAATQARNLAVEATWLTDATADALLGRAQAHAAALTSHLPEDQQPEELRGAAAATQPQPAPDEQQTAADGDAQPDEEEPSDEDAEEAAAEGMGALFG